MERHFHTHILPSKNKAVTSKHGYFCWSASGSPSSLQRHAINAPFQAENMTKKELKKGLLINKQILDGCLTVSLMRSQKRLRSGPLTFTATSPVNPALEAAFLVRVGGPFLMIVARRCVRRRRMLRLRCGTKFGIGALISIHLTPISLQSGLDMSHSLGW